MGMDAERFAVETRAVHAGRADLTALGVHVPPIDLSSTYPLPGVEAGGEACAFDLGSGAVRGMVRAGLDPFGVDRVFFTHFHPDHTVQSLA